MKNQEGFHGVDIWLGNFVSFAVADLRGVKARAEKLCLLPGSKDQEEGIKKKTG